MDRDRVAGLVILVVCTGLFYEGWRYPADSRLFPLALLAFLMVGAIVLMVRPRRSHGMEEEGDPLKTLAAMVVCLLYVVLVEPLGFFVSTGVFVATMMAMMGLRRPVVYLGAIGSLDLGLYLLFVWQLKVPVPAGILFQ